MILRVVLPALAFATVGWAGVRPHSRLQVDPALPAQIHALRAESRAP